MPLSAPEYWLEWTKNYFRCQFTQVGELIHKETWSAASFGWAEGLQTINPPIYRLTTAVSDIDQTNINRDIRDGNWLSTWGSHVANITLNSSFGFQIRRAVVSCFVYFLFPLLSQSSFTPSVSKEGRAQNQFICHTRFKPRCCFYCNTKHPFHNKFPFLVIAVEAKIDASA